MRVDPGNHIVRNELFKVAGGRGTRIHGTVVDRFGVWQNHDHVLRAPRKSAFDCLRNVDFLRPLLRPDRITMERIDDGIAAALLSGVAGRQKYDYFPVDIVAFQIALQCHAMDFDMLHGHWFRVRYRRRHLGRNLRAGQPRESQCHRGEHAEAGEFFCRQIVFSDGKSKLRCYINRPRNAIAFRAARHRPQSQNDPDQCATINRQ